MAMTLSGCATSGRFAAPNYPVLPADLTICFTDDTLVPKPAAGTMDKKKVLLLIADLKASETSKTDCGRRLITFYETLATRSGT